MDSSILWIVFLLVGAATLASYALSHWSSVRSALGIGWAATSMGTTMLLTAAAIVILTFVFRGPLWRPNLGTEQPWRDHGASSEETSRKRAASPLDASKMASTADPTTDRVARMGADQDISDGSPASPGSKQPAQQAITTISTRQLNGRSSPPVPTYQVAEPWAATQCVYSFNRDLGQPVRWKLVNDCGTPVGVAVDAGRSIVLPAPVQRSVALDEQTVDSPNYRACFVATPEAMTLIGAPSEQRSTATWRHEFETARANDACLMLLQNLAY